MTDAFPQPPVLSPQPPVLPEKWHGVAMLTPYRNQEIFAAEVKYDWPARAMLITMWGLEGSARQRLFVGDQFYIIAPPGENSGKIHGPFPSVSPVPPPDWLKSRAVTYVGSGAVMGAACDWWVGYSANVNGYQNNPPKQLTEVCNWIWVRKDTGLPFRLFFTNDDNPYQLPELGNFSTTVFTEFAPDKHMSLAPLVMQARAGAIQPDAAASKAISEARASETLQKAIDGLLAIPREVDPAAMAGKLIKGLAPPPADAPLPQWPDRLCITGYTYPTAKTPNLPPVLPMRVFYEWPKQRMLTRCALAEYSFHDVPVQDLILNSSTTHIVMRDPHGTGSCVGTLPVGLPKRSWAADAGGKPKAVIRDNPVLGPGETIHVTVIASSGNRWFWVWYTPQNDGRLFMETPQFGDVGLVLTDYARFDHNPPPFPDSAFEVPGTGNVALIKQE